MRLREAPGRFFALEPFLRTDALLLAGAAANLALGAALIVAGYLAASDWLVANGAYCLNVCVVGFYLGLAGESLRTGSDPSASASRPAARALLGAVLVVALVVSSFSLTYMTVWDGQHKEYPAHAIYGVAAYAFACLTVAIVGRARHRGPALPTVGVARTFSLVRALTSMGFLAASMIFAFGSSRAGASDSKSTLLLVITVLGLYSATLALALWQLGSAWHRWRGERTGNGQRD